VPATDAMRILPSLVLRGFARRRELGFIIVRDPAGPDPAGRVTGDGGAAA
jgi:hypothetical protein